MDAWHSILPNEPLVYHDHLGCEVGDNIQRKYLCVGTGGRRRCKRCEELGARVMPRLGAARVYEDGGDPLEEIAPRRRLGTAARLYETGGDPLAWDGFDPLTDLAPLPGRILGS